MLETTDKNNKKVKEATLLDSLFFIKFFSAFRMQINLSLSNLVRYLKLSIFNFKSLIHPVQTLILE